MFFSAHGVHLAVMDILYKKAPAVTSEDEDQEAISIQAGATLEGAETEAEDGTEASEEIQMAGAFYLEEFPADEVLPDFSDNYHQTVQNIRFIVKYFRYVKMNRAKLSLGTYLPY